MTAYSHESDFADRIRKISEEYQALTKNIPPDKDYKATLHLCLCQSLLTYCRERCMNSIEKETGILTDQPPKWGLLRSMVKFNSFCEDLTIGQVVCHLRNSVSHPTDVNLNSEYPSTGFKDVASPEEYIASFAFIHSPDVSNNGANVCKDGPKYYRQNELSRVLNSNGFPRNPEPRCVLTSRNGTDLYHIYVDEQPYTRIFRMDIPVDNLIQFVQQLSRYIANGENNDRSKQ